MNHRASGRALEIDDTAEDLYQRPMICHSRLDQSAEAMAAYQRCRDVLATTLQVKPSKRTEALLRELRHQ